MPVMLVDEMPEWGALGPKSLEGSRSPSTSIWRTPTPSSNARSRPGRRPPCRSTTPSGHHWSVATHVRDVSMEEMEEAMKAMQK
jgi:PhnB protein